MATDKSITKPPKGTRDFLPADVHRREHVTGIIRQVYEAHGFEPLETPAFERLETLLGKYGEEGDQLLFKILHRGKSLLDGVRESCEYVGKPGAIVVGRSGETIPGAEKLLADMGLRYDLTVPLARVYAEYQGKLPPVFKRYQIQPVWRADTPGKGRFREFYQCDVDVVGSKSLVVEAEVAGAVSESMERLGFDEFEIHVNHRGILRALIDLAGIDPKHEGEAIVAVDKLDKIGAGGVKDELARKGIDPAAQAKLLGAILGAAEDFAAVLGSHERGLSAYAEVKQMLQLAKSTPAARHVRFNPTLARGLGYYTGCIFELTVKDLQGSLGGGGRYDGLIGMFLGKDVPACGFSLGLERIMVVMEQRGMFPAQAGGPEVLLAATEEPLLEAALALAYELRSAGLRVELASRAEKPGKTRKLADDRKIPCSVLVESGGERSIHLKLWSRSAPDVTDAKVERADLARRIREIVGPR